MLSAALVVTLFLVPQGTAPDRSTPEKTITGFLEWKEGMPARNSKAFKHMLELEVLGAEHFAGKAREQMDAQRERNRNAVAALGTPTIETKVVKRSGDGDDSATLEVEVAIQRSADPKRASKRVLTFELKKHGDAWLIEKISRECWSCHGSGACPRCAKAKPSKRKCFACKGTGRCRVCKGKGFQVDESHLPKVRLALPSTKPEFSDDWSNAEAAAKSYADLQLRCRYEQSKVMKHVVDREVARLAYWLSPRLMKECHANVAKSVSEQETRYQQERLTVRKIELTGDKATAILDPDKGHRWPSVRHVEMKRSGDEWKVVEVRTRNRSAQGKPSGR